MFDGIIRELKREDSQEVENIFDLYWSDSFRGCLSKKLRDFVDQSPDSVRQRLRVVVAEENGEVVGVAALRRAPEYMRMYSTTDNPAEFYVVAVKEQGRGIGKALRTNRVEEARRLGYTEIVLFSGETHQDSWSFHDNSDFKRVGHATAPNGELGQIWRMVF